MRPSFFGILALFGLALQTQAQSCTGLCLQQVACTGGATTSISGVVYAPNGVDPLPNIVVYIPNAPVDAFTPGVSCPIVGQPPSGSPIAGTTTGSDGSFTLTNVPVGTNIPLVIVSGRWRRQVVVPTTTACTDTAFSTRMPRNKTEGDIPKIAIATGALDSVECVLRKVGIDDIEVTNPIGTGRINLFTGSGSAGARIDPSTPTENTLMNDPATLNQYDVLMLPCQGSPYAKNSTELTDLIQYANAGGRVYTSHFSYVWMYQNPPFSTVVNWRVGQAQLSNGIATVDTSFPDGQTLAQWLQLVGASTTPGQIAVNTLRHDFNGVNAPTQSWLRLNDAADGNPVMQFTFNTPVGAATNQCGRVLFNEYHVENPTINPVNTAFPAECDAGAMTPQEKLLEYSLFDLSNDGGAPTLTPTTKDFGNEPVGFSTPAQTFVLTNNSTFPLNITAATATGDFRVTANSCGNVPSGTTCSVDVVFSPTVLGPRTGTLTVGSRGKTLTSSLTGNGIPALSIAPASLDFGNVDVGAPSTKTLTLTNNAPGAVSLPPIVTTGDYTAATTCAASLPALSTCTISVTFRPSAIGARPGTLTLNSSYSSISVALTGNGVDFTITVAPTSATVIAGYGTSPNATVSPLAGFANTVTLICATAAPGSTCIPASASFVPGPTTTAVAITTTSQYAIIGFASLSGGGWLAIVSTGSLSLLWLTRRRAGTLPRLALFLCALAASSLAITGCSGKVPQSNPNRTPPGSYTYTLTATDGILTHSATFTLNVTAK